MFDRACFPPHASHAALESVVVSSGHEGNGLVSMDDAAVAALVQHCPWLHTLGLVRCMCHTRHCQSTIISTQNDCGVGDAGLHAVAHALAPYLQHLQLAHTRAWSEPGLVTALSRCSALTTLLLTARCVFIDPGVMPCSTMYSPCVTDAALASLLAWCGTLQHVDVSRCSHVTLDGAYRYMHNACIYNQCSGIWSALHGAAAGHGPLTITAYGCQGSEAGRERLLGHVAAHNMQQLVAGGTRVITVLL